VEARVCREGDIWVVKSRGLFGDDHALRLTRLGVGVDGPATGVTEWAAVVLVGSVLMTASSLSLEGRLGVEG